MQLPVNFKPRWYQAEALRALESGIRLAVWCWSRRGGKDKTAFTYAVNKMVEKPMNVVLVFPTKEQGRKSFWNNIENDGFKTLDAIPDELIASKRDDEMLIRLKNGSTFQVLGTKDPDALRGANGKLYIFSEFVDIDSAAYDVVIPIVEVNGGQVIIQSTPKIDGISGGTFKTMFDRALENWNEGDKTSYASLITAREYLSEETLERIRQDTIAKNGNDFWFRQEFLCDWGQASSTSYYGQVLKMMEESGRIGIHSYNPDYPVYTAWDLGMSDATAIVFFQHYLTPKGQVKTAIIDYYESSNLKNESHVKFVQAKPYNYAWHFFPHDGSVRDSDAVERIEKIREMGLTNSSLLRREPKDDGINRAIAGVAKATIHQPTTLELVRKLYLYKRKYNPLTGDYMGPEHKTESHAADTVRYMFCAIEQEFDEKTCVMYVTQASQDDTYESDLVETTFYQPSY